MKKIDYKHIAFHVLMGVYVIWVTVFAILIAMALGNIYGAGNADLNSIFLLWIFLNLMTGTALFLVLRQFSNKKLPGRLMLHTYLFMAAAAVAAVIIMTVKS